MKNIAQLVIQLRDITDSLEDMESTLAQNGTDTKMLEATISTLEEVVGDLQREIEADDEDEDEAETDHLFEDEEGDDDEEDEDDE